MFNYYQNINWVQGYEGAKAYQIYPNSNVILLDSETDGVMYIKTSDNVGMSKIRTFKYEEVEEVKNEYVTRQEVLEMIRGLRNEQAIPRDEQQQSNSNNQEPKINEPKTNYE